MEAKELAAQCLEGYDNSPLDESERNEWLHLQMQLVNAFLTTSMIHDGELKAPEPCKYCRK